MTNDTNNQLLASIAILETKVDMLEAELNDLNQIFLKMGFPEGIKTLKETAKIMLAEDEEFGFPKE